MIRSSFTLALILHVKKVTRCMIFQLTHVHLRLLEALMSFLTISCIYSSIFYIHRILTQLQYVRFNLAIRWWLFDLEIVYMCYLHVVKLDFHIQIVKKIASKKNLWRKLTTWSRLSAHLFQLFQSKIHVLKKASPKIAFG